MSKHSVMVVWVLPGLKTGQHSQKRCRMRSCLHLCPAPAAVRRHRSEMGAGADGPVHARGARSSLTRPEPATSAAWRSSSCLLSVDAERRGNQRFTVRGAVWSYRRKPQRDSAPQDHSREDCVLCCALHTSFSPWSGRLRHVCPRPGRRPRCCLQLQRQPP